MLKEKLGICLYEENYCQEEIVEIQDGEPIEEISKVSTKKSTKALIDESDNKSVNESDNESDKEPNKKSGNESNKESDNKNTTNWYDTNKFNKILTILTVTSLIIKIK